MWRWINQHDTSVGQRKILSPQQESNPWPPEHRADALSTELRELMESKAIAHDDFDSVAPSSMQDTCHIWIQLNGLALHE